MPSDASVQRLRKLNATVDLDKLEKEGKALLPQLLKYSQDMEDMQIPPQLQIKNLRNAVDNIRTMVKDMGVPVSAVKQVIEKDSMEALEQYARQQDAQVLQQEDERRQMQMQQQAIASYNQQMRV
jgi:hypothetical protein